MMAFGTSFQMFAQDGAGGLLQDLGGAPQRPADPPAVAAPGAQAPAVAEQRAPVVELDREDADLISELTTLEIARRKALDTHAQQSLETARKLLRDGDYAAARDQYKQALDFFGNYPANEAVRKEAETGMAEAFFRDAQLLLRQNEFDVAQVRAEEAVRLGHPRAQRLLDDIKRKITDKPPERNTAMISSRLNEEDYKVRMDDIRKRLRRSRQLFLTSEYVKALEECELILRDYPGYPGETEAIELRRRIAERMNEVSVQEFLATRTKMIQEVAKAWTPDRYAIESAQLPTGKSEQTTKTKINPNTGGKTPSQLVSKKLSEIIIPEVTFRPPATIIDAIDFFKQASRDYDSPEIPVDQRGVNLILKLPTAPVADNSDNPFGGGGAANTGAPVIPAMSARFISLYDALKLVCDVTDMKFTISGNIVMVIPKNDTIEELQTRSYNVLPTLSQRLGAVTSDLSRVGAGGGGGFVTPTNSGTREEDDWKEFFGQMGVKWPTGSAISYIAAIGKLRVTNTADQLIMFEQVLEELNVTPRLIEIETRFVEVSQDDLNSLGFEWMLNGDYSIGGGFAKNLFNMKDVVPGTSGEYDGHGNLLGPGSGAAVLAPEGSGKRMVVNGIDGNSTSGYHSGMRYLNTPGNPLAAGAETGMINDRFARFNAQFGGANLSMILHMLSQKSGTDLLSAPKVTTMSGQQAVIKVVTEYIYPSEYRVQISQQGNTGGGFNGGGTGEPLAIVEPQNFNMREVGVILDVTPTVSDEGQMIRLQLTPQVVSEPVWKNYGTKIPRQTVIPGALGLGDTIETTYIELPMEQPFFSVRMVETELLVANGATVVMGGLITEARQTIEDKVPFLGDIPFLGRLFRSRAEQTRKRNLLIFVTARQVDPEGRAIRLGGSESPLISVSGAAAE